MALTKIEFERLKASLARAATFDPRTVDSQVETSFDRSLTKNRVGALEGAPAKDKGATPAASSDRSKPGVVTKAMAFSASRGELSEDGGKRFHGATSDGLTVTDPGKKSNAGGSDILLAEWDDAKDRLCLKSIDVKSLQRSGPVSKIEAHENAHLAKSLKAYQDGYEKRLANGVYAGDEKVVAEAIVDLVKEVRADIQGAKESGLLKLGFDNTGGNSEGYGPSVDPQTTITDHRRSDGQGNVEKIAFNVDLADRRAKGPTSTRENPGDGSAGPKLPDKMRAQTADRSTQTSTEVSPAARAELGTPAPSKATSQPPSTQSVTTTVSAEGLANLQRPTPAGTPGMPPVAGSTPSPTSQLLPKGAASSLAGAQTSR